MSLGAESQEEKAIRLLKRQLEELDLVCALNYHHPKFTAWRDSTKRMLETFLGPKSPHLFTFRTIKFSGPPLIATDPFGPGFPEDYISKVSAENFLDGCKAAEATLVAVIRDIEDFGVYSEAETAAPRGARRTGGVSQTFHGPVTIHSQAIATDSAIQNIGSMGHEVGASLKEIAELLQQSEELPRREVREALAHIETLALEMQKPERARSWQSVLDCGQKVLEVAGKATDLAGKLAPYTPAIVVLMDKAKHFLT